MRIMRLYLFLILCSLPVFSSADDLIKMKNKVIDLEKVLDKDFYHNVVTNFSNEDLPNSKIPEAVRVKIGRIISLSNILNGIDCQLSVSEIELLQISPDLEFSGESIKSGFINEKWLVNSCSGSAWFQIAASAKGEKFSNIFVSDISRFDKQGKPVVNAMSF